MQRNKGFTLLELIIVVAVLAGLLSIAMLTYPASQKRARDTQRLNDLNQYKTALATYASYNDGKFPIHTGTNYGLHELCTGANPELDVPDCPQDPKNDQDYLYQSNASGTQFIIWYEKEAEKQPDKKTWAQCSDGSSGYLVGTPSNGACDIVVPQQPTPIDTPTPNPHVPTNTPVPTLSVAPTSSPTPTVRQTPSGVNLILNSSFENNKNNWVFDTDGSLTFRVVSGGTDRAYMAQIDKTVDDDSKSQLTQINVNVKPDTTYQLSLDTKSNNGNADFTISLTSGNSPYADYGMGTYLVNTTSSWKTYTTSFKTTPQATNNAVIKFTFSQTQVSRTLIDKIVLVEI